MTATPTPPAPGEDWAAQVVDYIVKTVDNLKRYTVDPVRTVTKALVFGTLAIGFALPAILLAAIALFHLLVQVFNAALPGPDDNAWMAWYLLGVICVVAGAFLFSRRNAAAAAEH